MNVPRPVASISLFMSALMRSKALNSALMPQGPVACLSLASCPIPFRGTDERARCTNKKSKQQTILRRLWYSLWYEGKKRLILLFTRLRSTC